MWYTWNQRNIVSQLHFNFKISLNKGVSLPVCYFSVKLVSSLGNNGDGQAFFWTAKTKKAQREVSVSLPPSASPPGNHCYEFLVEPSWEFSCKHFLFASFLKTEMVTNNAHLLTFCFSNLEKYLEVFTHQFLTSLLIPFYKLTSSLAIWVYNLQHKLRLFPIFCYYKPHSE